MIERKNVGLIFSIVFSLSLIISALTTVLMANFYQHMQFEMIGTILQEVIEEYPETRQTISAALKDYKNHPVPKTDQTLLLELGYHSSDFWTPLHKQSVIFAIIGFLFSILLFWITFQHRNRKEILRIQKLTDYLEQVNLKKARLLLPSGEDEFSKLQDEIYKTVTMLYQMRDTALETKNHFAENLSNIAHQLKTPITAISLSIQMMRTHPNEDYPKQIQKQLSRLVYLEEALLVLSRIDAGTLTLEKKVVDVFTVLTLAADNLQEIFTKSDVSVLIPELGEMKILADLDWTMEAIMNLLKNCIEHSPSGGAIHCFYEENLLYTEIRIWDEGQGFANEDIPHLFERFYRGQNVKEGGIGIGLALAKEIIERQNGTIRAKNMPNRGGCFEIRFYNDGGNIH